MDPQPSRALTRLIHGICVHRTDERGPPAVAEQLALGRALEGIVEGWVTASQTNTGDENTLVSKPPLGQIWACVVGLASVATMQGKVRDGASKSTSRRQPLVAVGAQLQAVLRRLAELVSLTGGATPSSGILVAAILDWREKNRCMESSYSEMLADVLAVLEICPLSCELRELAEMISQWLSGEVEEPAVTPGPDDDAEAPAARTVTRELPARAEEGAVHVSARLLATLRELYGAEACFGEVGQELREHVAASVRLLVALPLRPGNAWRVYVLACATLRDISPTACSLNVGALNQLPAPAEAACLTVAHVSEDARHADAANKEEMWLAGASSLLAKMLADGDN